MNTMPIYTILTAKGWDTYNKWDGIYWKELDRLRKEKNDPDYWEGWCIIDNDDFVKDIDDEIGLLIFGYDDGVLDHLKHFKERFGELEYAFDHTAQQLIDRMIKNGYVKEDD